MARAKKMASVARNGTRLEQLKNLSYKLADQIDLCAENIEEGSRTLPQLSKQFRETIKEIEEIEGVKSDDGIAELLSERADMGKPGTVRKNMS